MAGTRTLRDFLASLPSATPAKLVGTDLTAADATGFATSTQGSKADTALQPAAIGASIQAYNDTLSALAALVLAADKGLYATAPNSLSTFVLTAFARTLLDDVDAITARATLGAQATNTKLDALSALTLAADKGLYATGSSALATFDLSAFARTLLDDANAAAFYATLGQVPNAQIRSDITPDKAYRQGTIINTVSQASGVPTGGVIERGSNANGEYVKYADGTLLQWGKINAVLTVVDQTVAATFPVAFISATTLSINLCLARASFVSTSSNFNLWYGDETTTGFNLYLRNNAGFSAQTRAVSFQAWGRWF